MNRKDVTFTSVRCWRCSCSPTQSVLIERAASVYSHQDGNFISEDAKVYLEPDKSLTHLIATVWLSFHLCKTKKSQKKPRKRAHAKFRMQWTAETFCWGLIFYLFVITLSLWSSAFKLMKQNIYSFVYE